MPKKCECGKNCERIVLKTSSLGFSTMIMGNMKYMCEKEKRCLILGYDADLTKEIFDKVQLLYEQENINEKS